MHRGSFVCASVFQSVLSGYLEICYQIPLISLTVVLNNLPSNQTSKPSTHNELRFQYLNGKKYQCRELFLFITFIWLIELEEQKNQEKSCSGKKYLSIQTIKIKHDLNILMERIFFNRESNQPYLSQIIWRVQLKALSNVFCQKKIFATEK